MIVTIDGPAGTGKSTVARRLAKLLGFNFLDTGAMYRAVALSCLKAGASDATAMGDQAGLAQIMFDGPTVFLNGEDVTTDIRKADVTEFSSRVAAVPAVRSRLVEIQQEIGRTGDLVTEGRDQGSVVFPTAEFKFFLTAAAEERARRRQHELAARGTHLSLKEILDQQDERDRRDESRECSPLAPAADAILVDTTGLTVEEVVDLLFGRIGFVPVVDRR